MTKSATPVREQDIVVTKKHRVSCNGGGGVDGHPIVFMDMGQADEVICKYCEKKFVYKA